jgi:hypothetical protein
MKHLYIIALFLSFSLGILREEDIGFFWHITDLHYSPEYKEGSSQIFRCMKGTIIFLF